MTTKKKADLQKVSRNSIGLVKTKINMNIIFKLKTSAKQKAKAA